MKEEIEGKLTQCDMG